MNTIFASTIVLFVLLAAVIIYRQAAMARQNRRPASLHDTLGSCRCLLQLLTNMQQHRGMSTAWLSGDASFLLTMRERQATINALLPEVLHQARRESESDTPCFTLNDASLFQFRWRDLVDSLASKTPEESVAEQSYLIATVLEWLAALGEARIEILIAEEQIGVARNYAHRLPVLAECLGQARAIGSAVATRGACSPVARVRLIFLVGRAETLLQQATQANNSGQVTHAAQLAIREFSQMVRTDMLLSHGVSVNPQSYFRLATKAIDSVLAWVEKNGRQLETPDNRIEGWLINSPAA